MTQANSFTVRPIGFVRSTLSRRDQAPHQENEGAPQARLEILPEFAAALHGVIVGAEIIVLTWLHLGDRSVLKTHPRDNPRNPLRGVFATRSPDRPNPIGLHTVTVLEVNTKTGIVVDALEAIDGTPVLDIKPVLSR